MTPRVRELSPRGSGAIAILEVTGPGAVERLRILAGGKDLAPGTPALVTLRIGEETLDEALVLVEGSERCEIYLHGSPAVVEAVGAALGGLDAAPPPHTLEEAAWRDLASAPCEAAARILLDQAEGALGRALNDLADESTERAGSGVCELVEAGRRAAFALAPVTVVLAGPVNAGKSTLFNALLGEDRALVHGEAGTTRDAIGESACFGDWPVMLVDTAGERELPVAGDADEVEEAGQARARTLAADADLVLWCRPPGGPPAPEDLAGGDPITLHTRAPATEAGAGVLAALEEPEAARGEVARLFRGHFDLPERAWQPGAPVPFRTEHLEALGAWLRGRGRPGPEGRAPGQPGDLRGLLAPEVGLRFRETPGPAHSRAFSGPSIEQS